MDEPTAAAEAATSTEADVDAAAPLEELDNQPTDELPEGDEAQETEPDFEDIEYEGKQYKLPKELKEAVMRHGDYTQKTQSLAEERRAHIAEVEQRNREMEINNELMDDYAQLRGIGSRLEQLRNVDLNQISPEDATRLIHEQMQLTQAQQELEGGMNYRRQELEQSNHQRTQQELHRAVEALSKPDPKFGWNGKFDNEASKTLTSFGQELGFTREELANTTHPLMVKTLHLARIGAQALKKQQAALKTPAPAAMPVPVIGKGNAKGVVNPDKLPIGEWMKMEQARMAKKRA
jgi:hypothetical protein